MIQLGSRKQNLKAKVFGGSQRLESQVKSMAIGNRNILLAEQLLKEEKIPIVSKNTGGSKGRKIIFHTDTGDVLLKFIS